MDAFLARTCQAAVLRSLAIDRDQWDFPRWYHYQCHTADVSKVPPTHCGGRNYPESKPRANEVAIMLNLFYGMAMFDEEDKKAQWRLAKTLATAVDEVPRFRSSVSEKKCPMVADEVNVLVASENGVGKCYIIGSRRRRGNNDAKVAARQAQYRRTARCVESLDVGATTAAAMVVRVDYAVSKGKATVEDMRGMNPYSDALLFSRLRSSQATVDIEVVSK